MWLWLSHLFAFCNVGKVQENKTGMRAHMQLNIQVVIITFTVVVFSRCCCLYCFVLFHVFFFLQRIARNCSKVRAARAAQCFFLVRPIKYLILGVVITDPAVDANMLLSYLLHRSMYVNYRYPLRTFTMYWTKENLFSSCLWLLLPFILICLAVIFWSCNSN